MKTLEQRAQEAAEKHLSACRAAYWHEEMCGETPPGEMCDCGTDTPPISPAFAPFCECDTCVVREVLQVAWPFLKQLTEQ